MALIWLHNSLDAARSFVYTVIIVENDGINSIKGETIVTNDTLLSRMEAVKALNDAGFNVTYHSLSAWATRGGGPRFRKFGRTPLYRGGAWLDWAERSEERRGGKEWGG